MRLVDHVKDHLVVVPVDAVGDLITGGVFAIGDRIGKINDPVDGEVRLVGELRDALVPQDLAVPIRYEDADLVVCDKPAGMHVHPNGPHREGTLLNAMLWHCGARPDHPWGAWRPRPLHRLDRAAHGLVAFAKSAAVHDAVRRQFAAGTIHRRYHALVEGMLVGAGTIDAPLGRDPAFDYRRAVVADGQPAVTHWRAVEHRGERTLVELTLETGRTHQIRAHLASIGHPIVGDTLYMAAASASSAIELHAIELRMPHPRTGEPLVVQV